jgi:excisionase family DNA binding protein
MKAGKLHKEGRPLQGQPMAPRRNEAARALGLSIRTVDRAIKRGDLHAKRYGARVLVPTAEIERYLATLSDTGGNEKPRPA